MRYVHHNTATQLYCYMLDESYPAVKIPGAGFMDMSTVLVRLDPIAYREGFLNYLDAQNLTTDESEADDE